MNSIFGKPLESVTYEDVINFCDQQVKENLTLDYKRDLSNLSKVVKTLVSFANTNGGWVIVGVDDDDDKPKLPVTGMTFGEDYEQKINNSIISSVSPIVTPTYHTVHSPDSKFTIVIAHMPMSASTPHWMTLKGENTLFVRVGDRAKDIDRERFASSDDWELLRDRRSASTKLRSDLQDNLRDLLDAAAHLIDDVKPIPTDPLGMPLPNIVFPGERPHERGAITISISPEFPHEQITDVREIRGMVSQKIVSNGYNTYPMQTPLNNGEAPVRTYQDGAYIAYEQEYSGVDRKYFFGADKYGNLFNVVPIELSRIVEGKRMYFTEFSMLANAVAGALVFAQELYSENNYDTLLQVTVGIDIRSGGYLYRPSNMPDADWPWNTSNPPLSTTGESYVKVSVNASQLADKENRVKLLTDIMREIVYSFNANNVRDEVLERAVSAAFRK